MAQRLTVTLDINFLCIVQYSRATQNHSISPSRKEVALNRSKVGEQYPTIIVFLARSKAFIRLAGQK